MDKKIFYHDTDAGGVVYYANYLKYTEEARTLWFLARGIDIGKLANEKILFVVKKTALNYRAPAFYGDELTIETELRKKGYSSVLFYHRISNKKTKKILAEGETILACINHSFSPQRIPPSVQEKID